MKRPKTAVTANKDKFILSLLNILSFNVLFAVLNNTFNFYSIKKIVKKRPHICGAGWWGTLFLNQFIKKCNPLSVVQLLPSSYTTDSA